MDAWREVAQLGLFGWALPPACGGEGRGALTTSLVLEGLGRGGADRGLLLAIGAHLFGCALPFSKYATAAQIGRWGDGLRDGTIIGALAVTEAAGGSSFEKIATTAAERDGGYVLDGSKALICNASTADIFLVLARQFLERGALGLTAFVVPRDTAGLSVDAVVATGLAGGLLGDVKFDRCKLPADAVLGRPGAGLRVFMTAMQWERTCLLAGFLGAAEFDLVACTRTLHERSRQLLQQQAVSHRLAGMRIRLDAARLMMLRAACSIDRGQEDHVLAAMAKFTVSETIVACAGDVVRLLAGIGLRGRPLDSAAAMVDSLGGLFTSGTNELQLDLIARHLQAECLRVSA